LQRTGQVVAIKRPQAPAPRASKEDQALEQLTQLKAAQRLFPQPNQVFLADKDMTPARRRKIGLIGSNGMSRTWVESPRWRASEFRLPNGTWGYVVGPRSGLPQPKAGQRAGVIRRQR
jgi:hypothetical protein